MNTIIGISMLGLIVMGFFAVIANYVGFMTTFRMFGVTVAIIG